MPKEREEPRISVNKLGEYLVAGPVRRRRIVADQKRPVDFVVARYREATEAMIMFLEGGAIDDAIIENAIKDLMRKPTSSDFQEQDRDLSIEALWAFLDLTDAINMEELECRRGDSDPPKFTVADVLISVRPEIMLIGQGRAGERKLGLLKLYLVKTYPLSNEAGAYVGTVLQQYAAEHLVREGEVDYRLCQTLDVFARKVHTAPRSFRRRQNDIQAACEEITRAWAAS